MVWVLLLVGLILLILNAFFVLAEFAIVKVRGSKVEELIDQGNPRAKIVKHIQDNLSEYLSVCQVGITFASIGLGFVGEPAFARLLHPLFKWTGMAWAVAHTIAIMIAYMVVSFLHIWLGEQVPKMVGLRRPEQMALMIGTPLKVFRALFFVPIRLLNGATNVVLKLLGASTEDKDSQHTEEELRIILEQSQARGLMSFRRLLLVENIFDLGDLKVRDAMRSREAMKSIQSDLSWPENLQRIRESRFSRYPLVDGKTGEPLGILHVKDLLYEENETVVQEDIRKLLRPFVTTTEDTPLENLLENLQSKRGHLAVVKNDSGAWSGFITLEDIIEEIVGTIEDEFEPEPQLTLTDALTAECILLDVNAENLESAIHEVFVRIPASELPFSPEKIEKAVQDRERAMSTYLGRGLAVPHARLDGMPKPLVILALSTTGIPVKGWKEKAHFLFMILTPADSPRFQARLLSRIAGLMDSEYVVERLREAKDVQAVMDAIRAGDPVALS